MDSPLEVIGCDSFAGMRKAVVASLIALIPYIFGAALEFSGYVDSQVAGLCSLVTALSVLWIFITPILLDWEHELREALNFSCRLRDGWYATGTEFAGIQWRKEFVDVRLHVQNRANVPIENVDLLVRFDTSLAGIGQTTGVAMERDIAQSMRMDAISVGIVGEEAPDFPISGNPEGFHVSSPNSGRIRLPVIPRSFTVDLVLATVAMSASEDNRIAPEWIEITGHYETTPVDGGQRYQVRFRHEFR